MTHFTANTLYLNSCFSPGAKKSLLIQCNYMTEKYCFMLFICTDILTQWERLHAFAKERQSESSELSMMNKCLEEMEAELSSCDEGIKAFKSLRDVEHSLISTKVTCEANVL